MLEKLHFKAHKSYGSIGLVELFLTAMLRLIAGNMGDKCRHKTCKIELP